jgi:hypothetical protein
VGETGFGTVEEHWQPPQAGGWRAGLADKWRDIRYRGAGAAWLRGGVRGGRHLEAECRLWPCRYQRLTAVTMRQRR